MSTTEVTNKLATQIKHDSPDTTRHIAKRMTGIINKSYGVPEDLQLCQIDKPLPKDNELLIRNHAAALHIGDSFAIRGKPLLMRLATGLLRPTYGVPGFDFSGTVVEVGKDVTRFKPGDEVFGECNGSCAEYLTVNEDKPALKPNNLDFEQAAALATSGLAALHAVRDVATLKVNQSILINGASGGVGTFAVQLAKSMGAEVTGVCGPTNAEMLYSIGADHVIDYTQEDFSSSNKKYDVVFDNVENRSLADCRKILKPKGVLILNSGTGANGLRFMWRLFKPLLLHPFVRQHLRRYVSVPTQKDLVELKRIVETGTVSPVVDRVYPLADVPEAIRYIESGRAKGKVVVGVLT